MHRTFNGWMRQPSCIAVVFSLVLSFLMVAGDGRASASSTRESRAASSGTSAERAFKKIRRLKIAKRVDPRRGPIGVRAPKGSVPIRPGQRIQRRINSKPPGTVFKLKNGVHVLRGEVKPKARQQFWAETGGKVIIRGNGAYGSFGGTAPKVELHGLIIEGFAEHPSRKERYAALNFEHARGWKVVDSVIRRNCCWGVKMGHNTVFKRNIVHRNGRLGLAGGGKRSRVVNNEIHRNNPQGSVKGWWEKGGTKFVHTEDLIVKRNYSHRNGGPGFWTDIDNKGARYLFNRLENNEGPGIFHEISYGAKIRHNVIRFNGHNRNPEPGVWWGKAGILVSASRGVRVFGNRLIRNAGGIHIMQQERKNSNGVPYLQKNTRVYENKIVYRRGYTGFATNIHTHQVLHQWNNRFENNVYRIKDLSAKRFWFDRNDRTKKEWTSLGQDSGSRFYELR